MRTKQIIMLLLIAGASFKSSAQTYYINKVWEKELGGYNLDFVANPKSLLMDNNNNIYVLGYSESNVNGNKTVPNCGIDTSLTFDYWLIKLNQSGNIIWQKTYGGEGDEFAHSLCMKNNTITLAGISGSNISCDKSQDSFDPQGDFWLIKIDTAGQKIWDGTYGTLGIENRCILIPTDDEGYFIFGTQTNNAGPGNLNVTSHGSQDYLAVKIDSTGNVQWDSLYGSTMPEPLRDVMKDANNNYLLVGSTGSAVPNGNVTSPNIGGSGSGNDDNWLVKIDSLGHIFWDKRFGCISSDYAACAIQNNNGNYVIGGNINGNCIGGTVTDTVGRGVFDIWVYELDSANGNILSDKRIGGNLNDRVQQIAQSSDNGYLLVGQSESDAGFEKTENSYGWNDIWVIRTDSLFNILWDKTIGGNYDEESSPSVILLNDSTFILACTSHSDISGNKGVANFDTSTSSYHADIWLTKWSVSTVNGINELSQPQFTLYPNPVKDVLYLTTKKSIPVNSVISIIDIQGRIIKEEEISKNNSSVIPIDVSALSQGVYLLRMNGVLKRFVKL